MKGPTAERDGRGPGTRVRGPLVERPSELDELSSALSGARAGHGALFLVAGEAGIGKTRLAEAVADEAAEQGDTVLWGSAWEAGGAPAYWPWTQVIRELLHERPAQEVIEDLGSGAPYVARIAPELSERLPTTARAAPSLDTEAARFSVFDATASFLRAAAERRSIAIFLDDLHAADLASIRLLEFLARRLRGARLLAVCTYRAGNSHRDDEVTAALVDLGKASQRLVLGGLSRNGVQQFAAALAPPLWLVDRLHALTEGNPLFVDEILRLLVAEGALDTSLALAGARLPLPDGVRATIRRRLDPVQPAVVRALTAAAVIGRDFRLETLARVTGENRTALLAQLDEAAEAGLVEELPGAPGRYRLAHALIRETLYDGLAMQERVALHSAVGEALVDLYGDGPDAPLSELAHHFLQAAPTGDPARAADYAARAGEQALTALAYEQAIDSFGDALRALDLQPSDPRRRGSILLAMGTAEMRAGRLEAGRGTLRKAAELGRRVDDTELLARAALMSAPWGLATAMSDEEGLIPLLEEALERLPPTASALRARVLTRFAATLYWSAPPDRRGALAEEGIAMARQVGDAATLALVLSDAHLATWDPDSPERALSWASEIYALAERVGNMELALTAHSWRISLLLELGELANVDLEIEAFARIAKRLHQPRGQIGIHLHACARALIDGHFDEAERLLEKAADYAGLVQEDQFLGMRVAALAFVMRYAQGRLPELEPAVRQFADAQPAMPVWRCGLLCVHLQTGNETELRREYERLSADSFGTLPRDNLWLPAVAFLAEACAHLGDRQGAGTLESLLAPYAGRNVVTPDVAYVGPVDRYLALVAATAGHHEQAATWFASALGLARKMGAGPMSAQLALDEATALRERDPARSAALAADAAEQAEALGLERVAAEARRFVGEEAPATRPATLPAASPVGRLHRRGDVWEVVWAGVPFHVKDAKGLHYLVRLLAQPGKEVHVLDLAGGTAGPPAAEAVDPDLVVRAGGQGDPGPRLDAQAKAEYRQRVADLQEEIEEAEAFHDPERASRAREELDFVTRELSAAVGLGGRDRRARADAERARVRVTRRLRATLDHIEQHDAALGHHLRTCVRTGTFCVYEPGPDASAWDIDAVD